MIHLELTNNMSTEEFLSALKRMINRRGKCRKIISDNQLTFKKANQILKFSTRESVIADNSLNLLPLKLYFTVFFLLD